MARDLTPKGISVEEFRNLPGVYIIKVRGKLEDSVRQAWLEHGSLIENRQYRLTERSIDARADPDLWRQWHLFSPQGWDADIFQGWAFLSQVLHLPRQNLPIVPVAVLDTGVDLQHPELAHRLARNETEIADNGRDDDGNGYVDDVWGWNFSDKNNVPQDDNLHGTHVAGIIAAADGNGLAGAGVASNARIIPVKVFDAGGGAASTDLVRAIDYAVGRGARIINASWGGFGEDELLEAAVREATRRGVLFVAAAGNDASDVDLNKSFLPCGYPFAGVLCVGAIGRDGRLASFSNYGVRSVDVFAPGVDIYSTLPGGQQGSRSGTSMATPVVSGLAALLAGAFPQRSSTDIKEAVMLGAGLPSRQQASLAGKGVTAGVVSLVASLGGDPTVTYDNAPPEAVSSLEATSEAHFAVDLRWGCAKDDISVAQYEILREGALLGRTSQCIYRDETSEGGRLYTYVVRAIDWAGNSSLSAAASAETPLFGASGAWSRFPVAVESPHPYPKDTQLSWDISLPTDYRITRFRILFRKFDTEDGFDTVTVSDSNGNQVATYSGERGEFLSAAIPGSTARITLKSDRRNTKFGFVIDSVQAFIE
jgi:hypothetical protein